MRIKKEVDDDGIVGREQHEQALFAKDSHPHQFKGTCYKYGKYGHTSIFCPYRADDANRQYLKGGSCLFCAGKGHQLFACEKFQEAGVKSDGANLACDEKLAMRA